MLLVQPAKQQLPLPLLVSILLQLPLTNYKLQVTSYNNKNYNKQTTTAVSSRQQLLQIQPLLIHQLQQLALL